MFKIPRNISSVLKDSISYILFKNGNKRNLASKVLGIETSCDDTGVAIVDTAGKIIGESLFSQQSLHAQ